MQYLLMLYTNEAGFATMTPAQQEQGIAAYMAFSEALKKAKAFVSTNRLQGSKSATTVRVNNGKNEVLDGPYADSKEQIGGYYLIEADNLDAALSWAARCPAAQHGVVEVRPVWAM